MTLTLNLSAELERQLRARAAQCGKDVETVARELIEQGISARSTLDTILAPFRNQFAASGISEDGLTALFEEAREEVHSGHARNQP
jgi:plasmid stability protein